MTTALKPPTLFYGDNLVVLREHVPDESVDLVYLDPPFNSQANYNVLFKSPTGVKSTAQIEAFKDTWHWGEEAEQAYGEVLRSGGDRLASMMRAMVGMLQRNDLTAYLAMMSVRLVELRRVLKPTGSLYLHCDPTASHYLKLLLDAVFGAEMYRNEITWKRTSTHSDSKTWSRVADTLFFYTRGEGFCWNVMRAPHSEHYVAAKYRYSDPDGRVFRLDNMTSPNPRKNMMYEWKGFAHPKAGWRYERATMERLDGEGRIWYPTREDGSLDTSRRPRLKRYLDEMEGGVVGTVWTDIPPINSQARERLGYPTQKPLALLERIIEASSREGDVVLDPFCGCGTAIHAAQKLGRNWVGIDITHLAISLIEKRMHDAFPELAFEVVGTPKDVEAARDLAARDKYQFQWWAVSLVNAQPYADRKKGADTGIDGRIYFLPDGKRTETAIVSVEGGKSVGVTAVRELKAVVEREGAAMGVLISLAEPTREMLVEQAAAGMFATPFGEYPRIQVFTIGQLLDPEGPRPQIPLVDRRAAFKKAAVEVVRPTQKKLL